MEFDKVSRLRSRLNSDPAFEAKVLQAANTNLEAVAALLQREGFAVTAPELEAVLLSAQNDATLTPVEQRLRDAILPYGQELSDHELDLVSGGSSPSCQYGGGNARSDDSSSSPKT